MLQGWFDASGTKGQSIVSLAGFSADVAAWADFSDEWDVALKRHHIAVFKMQVESKRKPIARRNERIADFWAIIRKYAMLRIESSISIPDFNLAVTKSVNILDARLQCISPNVAALAKQLLDDPYFWIIGNLVAGFCAGVWERGFRDPFDMFFDTQILEMCPGSPVMYGITRSIVRPQFQRMLPAQPISRSDEEFRPLQAADLLAWITRRQHEKTIEGWEWLVRELDHIDRIPCRFVNAATLRPQVSAFYSYVLGRSPRFNQALIDHWSTFFRR